MKFFNFRGKQKRKSVAVPSQKKTRKSAPKPRRSSGAANKNEPSTSAQAARPSTPEGTTPKKCPVCGDVATRKLNDMPVCHACQRFYLRRVTSNTIPELVCEGDQNCVVTLKNRSCNSCRFKKCLEVGMSASRFGNTRREPSEDPEDSEVEEQVVPAVVPAAEPEVIELNGAEDSDSDESDSSSSGSSDDVQVVEPGVYPVAAPAVDPNQMVITILTLYAEKCPYTTEKVRAIERRAFGWKPKPNRTPQSNRVSCWVNFSGMIEDELKRLLGFVPKLQTTIDTKYLKQLFFKHVFSLLHLWWTRALTDEGLVFEDGRFVEKRILQLLFGEQMLDEMLDVSNELRRMNYSDRDLAMLIGLVFLQPCELNHPFFEKVSREEFYRLQDAFIQYETVEQLKIHEALAYVPRINALNRFYKQQVGVFLFRHETCFPKETLFYDMFVQEKLAPAPRAT